MRVGEDTRGTPAASGTREIRGGERGNGDDAEWMNPDSSIPSPNPITTRGATVGDGGEWAATTPCIPPTAAFTLNHKGSTPIGLRGGNACGWRKAPGPPRVHPRGSEPGAAASEPRAEARLEPSPGPPEGLRSPDSGRGERRRARLPEIVSRAFRVSVSAATSAPSLAPRAGQKPKRAPDAGPYGRRPPGRRTTPVREGVDPLEARGDAPRPVQRRRRGHRVTARGGRTREGAPRTRTGCRSPAGNTRARGGRQVGVVGGGGAGCLATWRARAAASAYAVEPVAARAPGSRSPHSPCSPSPLSSSRRGQSRRR